MEKLILTALLLPTFAMADGFQFNPVIGLKAQYGGDTLATIIYTDSTTQELAAGQGIDFYAGMLATKLPYQLKGTVGYKYSSSMASNIDVAKTALPVNLTGRYKLSNGLFAGGGLTLHLSPQLALDDVVAEYEASPGYHVEAGWNFISLGWTHMTYELGATSFDASSFDVNLEMAF
jgi:hypothetical protein